MIENIINSGYHLTLRQRHRKTRVKYGKFGHYLFAENMTAGRGWIAVVAVMLGRAHPLGIAVACLGFGLADAIGLRLQGQGLPNQITDIAPYAITLLAMIGLGLRGMKKRSV